MSIVVPAGRSPGSLRYPREGTTFHEAAASHRGRGFASGNNAAEFPLEHRPQRQLDDARAARGAADDAHGFGRRQSGGGRREISVVQDIQEVGSELDPSPLARKRELFADGEVPVNKARRAENVAAGVPEVGGQAVLGRQL